MSWRDSLLAGKIIGHNHGLQCEDGDIHKNIKFMQAQQISISLLDILNFYEVKIVARVPDSCHA